MDITEEIKNLKKAKNAVIIAHNYQLPEVQDIADFTGDSLELSRKAMELEGFDVIVFCGVRFMAETAKILSPGRKVLLPEADAGCPMADMADPEGLLKMKEMHPGAWVVSYVNTSAAVKALSDVCCTSANADAVVRNAPRDKVIFLPDRNLCWYVRQKVKGKEIVCWDGYCIVHRRFKPGDVAMARKLYPSGEVIVHPECDPEVQSLADGVYSTSGMLRRVRESLSGVFIVGTEEGLIHRMKIENPGKTFYSLGPARTCSNMKKTTLSSVKNALVQDRYPVELDPDVIRGARRTLERMIEYI